jgi:HK97 family phage major capsid protein
LVDTTIQYQEALRKKLVLTSAGANYMGALTGNIDMVDGMAIKARWGAENGEIESTKKSFSTRSISPLRLGINVPVSKQLILQASKDVEQIIMADMIAAHAEALETAALNGTGTGYEPKGLLNTDGIGSVSIGTNGGIPTFENIVALETAVANANADLGSLAYVTNTKVRGAMKTVLKSAGVGGYIWENNEMNGYKAFASNCVPDDISKGTSSNCSAIIFGNWNDLWICQWGGLDVVVDPYTLKTKGAIDIMLNAYHNIFVKRGESFAAIKDATV